MPGRFDSENLYIGGDALARTSVMSLQALAMASPTKGLMQGMILQRRGGYRNPPVNIAPEKKGKRPLCADVCWLGFWDNKKIFVDASS